MTSGSFKYMWNNRLSSETKEQDLFVLDQMSIIPMAIFLIYLSQKPQPGASLFECSKSRVDEFMALACTHLFCTTLC